MSRYKLFMEDRCDGVGGSVALVKVQEGTRVIVSARVSDERSLREFFWLKRQVELVEPDEVSRLVLDWSESTGSSA